jgi:hypothetical protein
LAPFVGAALAGALARWLQIVAPEAMRARGEPERATAIPGRPVPTT